MEDAISLSTSLRRGGMEPIKPGFFLSFRLHLRLRCLAYPKMLLMQAQQNETVSAVLPGRLYKAHTPCTRENDHALPCINYHFREKTQRLLL